MTLKEQLQEDLKTALFARDELKVSTIRMLMAGIKNFSIEKQKELEDADVVSLVERSIKRHRESIDGFEKGERAEMAEKEKKELEILQTYLPEQISEEQIAAEVEQAISSTGAS